MADESIGTARIDVIVGTDQMDVAIERAKSRLSSMSSEAQKAYAGMNSAEKKRIDSLIKQADTIGFTREQQILYNAALKGTPVAILDDLKAKMGGVSTATAQAATAATKAFSGTNKSAKELQFAMRGLPAQFTDIFTSLASGQRPMMVLLQQGGQIKDLFGGIVPALRAVGNGVMAMINPFTVTAGVVAALGFAWKQAEEDASAFNKALLVTGNYAGKTSMQLEAMVESIANTANTTQGSAREALQKVAETGRFTGAQFDLVATAAARMESATGQSIDSTIKKFEDLAKSPVDALLKLNETEHFLTDAQLERVRALMAEGKEQEAAAEAARIYADRLDDVGKAAEAARPHLSKLWSDAWKEIDAVVERTKNFAEFLAAAADKYKEMPWYKRMTPVGALSSLYGAEPATPAVIAPVAGAIDSNQAKAAIKLQEDAAKFKDRYLTREQEKTRELADLDKLRAQYSEQEYQGLKKQIDLKFAEKPKRGKADPFNTLNGLVQDAQAFDQGVGVDADQNKQAAAIRKIVDAGAKLIASGHDMATVQATVAVGVEKLNDGYAKQAAILRSQNVVSLNAYRDAIKQQVADKQRQIDLEVASIGMGEKEAQQQLAVAEIYARVNKTIEQLNRQRSQKNANTEFIEGEIAAQKASIPVMVKQEQDKWRAISAAQADGMNGVQAAIKNFMGQQKDMAGQMSDLTTKLIGGFGDAFASFASGAESAKSAFGSLIDDMYRQALKFLANKAIQGIFDSFSATGGGSKNSTPGSSAGGWGSILGNIVNAFTTKSANGNVFTSSGLSAYSGQVVSQPTMFAFAHGAGLMGEAGPEAIMPLRRLPNGKLGVEASNSRPESAPRNYRETTINVNVQPTSTRRTADQVAQTVARRQRMAQARNG